MQILFSVGVCGSRSGVGKTFFIENFIRYLKKRSPETKIVAIKYTKTSIYSSITTEPEQKEGKDTTRMKLAGADYIVWVRAREEDLPEVVLKAKEYIHSLDANIVIIEGNSLVRLMQPDVIIFFKDSENKNMKPSAKSVIEEADIVIEGKYSVEEIMTEIENIQNKRKIYQLLKERSNDGKITCAEARKIAEELSVAYIEVGKAANELGIKIRKCELGCF